VFSVLLSFANFVVDLFKSRRRLEAENLLLRQQLNVALRDAPRRLRLCGVDRAVLVGLVRSWPDLARSVRVVKPRRFCVGIGWGSAPIGAGDRRRGQGGRRLTAA